MPRFNIFNFSLVHYFDSLATLFQNAETFPSSKHLFYRDELLDKLLTSYLTNELEHQIRPLLLLHFFIDVHIKTQQA